jgi:hypothetical protein
MKKIPRLAGLALLLPLVCLPLASCGYALAGRGTFLPAHIRTIGVPAFVNHTPVFDIDRRITEKVRSELIGRGRYTVNPDATGDGILRGEISSIRLDPSAWNAQRLAIRHAVVLTAKVEFIDSKDGKVIWSNPALTFREEYPVTGTTTDPAAFFGQDVNAMDRISSEFARTLVSAILEAF